MKLKNILIVVNDIELAKKFYHDLFGLEVLLDSDGNVIMTEGLRSYLFLHCAAGF